MKQERENREMTHKIVSHNLDSRDRLGGGGELNRTVIKRMSEV